MPKDRWEQFNEIADNTELTGNEKLLMILIFRYYSPKHGYSYPTLETLKEKMGYSHTRYVLKNIKSLVDKGYIRKETVKQNNRYYILTESDVQNIPKVQNVHNVQNIPFDYVQNVPTANVQNVPTKRKQKENIKENIYSDLDNEDYVNKINEELEEDLFNRVKSNYDPGAIKKELDNLKDKGLSKLDLLKELENNLKIKSIETKEEKSKDVEEIFNYWNNKKIIKHKEITPIIKKEIIKILKKYSAEEVKQAIDLYSEILKSEFYFSYKWSLGDFLKRNNGISTFMEEGSNKANYEEWKSKNKLNNDTKIDFDDEKYII
ncbi:helix-turn-helix domain-containing protein [Clostridium saudiense]|uniref:helix-turn-helix domain-containing protein n=1 Tax=Clostridium saudiense TaxID=1414720 RepID=UPI003264B08A